MREFPSFYVELFSEYFLQLNFINRRELDVECQAGAGLEGQHILHICTRLSHSNTWLYWILQSSIIIITNLHWLRIILAWGDPPPKIENILSVYFAFQAKIRTYYFSKNNKLIRSIPPYKNAMPVYPVCRQMASQIFEIGQRLQLTSY